MGGRAQLFVGRLPLDTRERDVEQVFEKYGRLLRCDVKYGTGMAYAFVDYDDRRDAEDSIKYEHGREIRGQSIVVEWARGPSYRPGGRGFMPDKRRMSGKMYDECYRCRRSGHWARDCPEQGRDRFYGKRYRSRSRSRSRSRRYRSDSNDDKKRDGRSRSSEIIVSRTPSRSRSPSKEAEDKRSNSENPRSRSPSVQENKADEEAKENGDDRPDCSPNVSPKHDPSGCDNEGESEKDTAESYTH